MFISTPFCWRPFVQFVVEAHIKEKLNELSVNYVQLAMQLPDKREFSKLRSWLISTSSECKTLKDTLTTWKNGQIIIAGAVPILLGGISSWLGTDNLIAILPKLNSQLFQISILSNRIALTILLGVLLSVAFLFSLLNFAFEGKRTIFLPYYLVKKLDLRQDNIYATEDDLYKLIRRKKTPEFPIDAYAASIGVLIIFISLITVSSIVSIFLRLVIIFFFVIFLITAIYPSRYRWN
jgi:hypothetical protein